MSDFQISTQLPRPPATSKIADFESDMALEVSIGAAARLARVEREVVHDAIFRGALPHHRDHDGRRVVTLGALLAWMRAQPAK
ncbi:MAG TPA: hypothetical protein VFE60_22020 [Roseiarcus sp.]|jgi:hypothetical protein|nr:hypothetical protein [Roseiarcus sp.]